MKTINLILFFLVFVSVSFSQNINKDSLIAKIKYAYLTYDTSFVQNLRSEFKKLTIENNNTELAYFKVLIGYKFLEMNLRNSRTFNNNYKDILKDAEKLIETDDLKTEGMVLKAAIYMMKIASNPISAVTLSSKIHQLLDEAQMLNPDYAYTYVIRGMMKFNTPEEFGGSYNEALKNFSKAVFLYEKSNANPPWGYAEALVWLGRTYFKIGDYQSALFSYKRALNAEPYYRWVEYFLIPEVNNKLKKENDE